MGWFSGVIVGVGCLGDFVVSLLCLVGFGDFRWFTALDLAFCGVIAFPACGFCFLAGLV